MKNKFTKIVVSTTKNGFVFTIGGRQYRRKALSPSSKRVFAYINTFYEPMTTKTVVYRVRR